jgi:tetratricopeptide (TPR) repeat protein
VADPFSLSHAAYRVESELSSEHRFALVVRPTVVAEAVKSVSGVATVRLWEFPFQSLRNQLNLLTPALRAEARAFEPFAWRPQLWRARVLQFHGRKQAADEKRGGPQREAIDDHRQAVLDYTSPQVRPAPRNIARAADDKKRVDEASSLNAAYWLGLLLYDEHSLDVATQWLKREELVTPESPWLGGTHYNLGRTYEALGRNEDAIKQYESGDSPQKYGNRLRARTLREQTPTE